MQTHINYMDSLHNILLQTNNLIFLKMFACHRFAIPAIVHIREFSVQEKKNNCWIDKYTDDGRML